MLQATCTNPKSCHQNPKTNEHLSKRAIMRKPTVKNKLCHDAFHKEQPCINSSHKYATTSSIPSSSLACRGNHLQLYSSKSAPSFGMGLVGKATMICPRPPELSRTCVFCPAVRSKNYVTPKFRLSHRIGILGNVYLKVHCTINKKCVPSLCSTSFYPYTGCFSHRSLTETDI